MRKLISIIFVMAMVTSLFAGGIVTNTNQSAMYVRTLNRNASTDLDAAYFNPAGLMSMNNGFYAHISNQSIFQLKGIESSNPMLNEDTFEGNVKAMFFPDVYLAYKQDKFAVSAAVMPIGGGGSAEYEDGLPSFEAPVAGLVPMLTAQGVPGVQGYRDLVSFKGSSIYLGFQAGVSYEVNDMFSVYLGGRYVTADNSYEGYLRDVELNIGGTWMAPGDYFYGASQALTAGGAQLQGVIDAGAGGYTLDQLVSAEQMSAAQAAAVAGGLAAAGLSADGLTVEQIQGAYNAASAQMSAVGDQLSAATADMEVDATRHGFGFCGIVGLNITPNEDLNIGLRYESQTALEMKNDTKVDGSGLFPDGAKIQSDMPAMFAAGISYNATSKIRLESSLNYYFDENVDWDGREELLENCFEAGIACEYSINDAFRASLGYLYATSAATDEYRSDMDFGLNSNSIALGVGVDVNESLIVDLGFLNTFYQDAGNSFDKDDLQYENYYKSNYLFAVGFSYKF